MLTVGATAVLYAILALLHASDSVKHMPAGGVCTDHPGTAARRRLSAGVFKELVVTGRSRRALRRGSPADSFLLPIVTVGYAITAAWSVVFAGSLAAPSFGLLVSSGAWLMLVMCFWFALALGLSSLVGSRSTRRSGFLIRHSSSALAPALMGLDLLGIGRAAVPGAGLARRAPHAVRDHAVQGVAPPMSAAAAVAAVVLTVAIALALGAWRTATRDA